MGRDGVMNEISTLTEIPSLPTRGHSKKMPSMDQEVGLPQTLKLPDA